MATRLTAILQRLDELLRAHAPAGTLVHQARAEAVALAEGQGRSINVLMRGDGALDAFADEMDLHEDVVEIHLQVRDDAPLLAAETLHEAVHAPIVEDLQLNTLAEQVRLSGSPSYTGPQEADTTALTKIVRYRFIYTIPRNQL